MQVQVPTRKAVLFAPLATRAHAQFRIAAALCLLSACSDNPRKKPDTGAMDAGVATQADATTASPSGELVADSAADRGTDLASDAGAVTPGDNESRDAAPGSAAEPTRTELQLAAHNSCVTTSCGVQEQSCTDSKAGPCKEYLTCLETCGCGNAQCAERCGRPSGECLACRESAARCVSTACPLPACTFYDDRQGTPADAGLLAGLLGYSCGDLDACCRRLTAAGSKAQCLQRLDAGAAGGDLLCSAHYQLLVQQGLCAEK